MVFYYSGHGVPDKWGATFLAPSDIDSDHPFMTGFSFVDLTNSMLACNSLRVVTILDSCYSGSLELSKGLDSKSGEEAATRIANKIVEEKGDKLKQGVGRCLLASSQGYEEAYDRMEKDHSIFTYYLLEALNGHKNAVDDEGNVTYDSVGRFISREIGSLPPERRPNQTPIRKGEVSGGDIVLAHYTKQPVDTKLMENSSAAEPAITRALESIADEDYTTALTFLDKALALDPKNAKAYLYQGKTFAKLEKYEEAINSYQKALEIDPNPEYVAAVSRLLGMITKYVKKKRKGDETEAKDIQNKIQKNVDSATEEINKKNSVNLDTAKPIQEEGRDKVTNELLKLLCQGEVEQFNEKVSKSNFSDYFIRGVYLNFPFANLSGANLSGANLSRANLSNANLSNANLSNADFPGANLANANLSGANLSNANLSGADLSGADLSRADLTRADVHGATLSAADLSDANLSNASIWNANLAHANLSGANLSGAILSDADLQYSLLIGCKVSSHARVDLANFNEAIIDDHKLTTYLRVRNAMNVPYYVPKNEKELQTKLEQRGFRKEEIKRLLLFSSLR